MNDGGHTRIPRNGEAHDLPPSGEEREFAERYADAIDAYASGTLDDSARRNLERLAARDARLRDALDDAVFSRAFFSGTERERADPALDARILAAIDAELAVGSARTPAPRHRARRSIRWAAWAAAAAVLALVVHGIDSRWIGDDDPGASTYVAADGSVFTEAEVRVATEQMAVAMAVFGRTLDRTADAVQVELTGELRAYVREPLREGLGRSVNSIPFLTPRGGEQEHSGNIPRPTAGERPLRSRALESAHLGERT